MTERQGYRVPSLRRAVCSPQPGSLWPAIIPPQDSAKVTELPVSTCFITKLLTEETPHNDDASAPPLTSDP